LCHFFENTGKNGSSASSDSGSPWLHNLGNAHTKCRLFRFGFGYLKLPEAKWCFFEIIEKYRPEKSIDAVLDLSRKSLDKPDQTSPNLRRDHRIS
jgi:hypothetical protein